MAEVPREIMRKEILILGSTVIAVIAIAVIGSNYYISSLESVRKGTGSAAVTGTANPDPNGSPIASATLLVRPDSSAIGPENAKVTLVEFYDPECHTCAAFGPIVKKILDLHEGRLKFVVRYLPQHTNSELAVSFTEAAGEQGKYWEARDLLFARQKEWGTQLGSTPDPAKPKASDLFNKYAEELGLDTTKIARAISEGRFQAKIEQDKKDAKELGVRKTPSFFVNGRELASFGEPQLRHLVNQEMNK